VRDGEDFIVKWLKSLIEVAVEVERDNRYDCIDYNMNKIMNYVTVLGYNSARFDMNFLINILHDPPNHHVESIIGNLVYFKQLTVRTADGTCLKFLDVMEYVKLQTLEGFVKTFSNKKNLQKGVFENYRFNSSNYMEVLNKTEPCEQQDFH
jgi:hypothetical protein